MSTLVFFSSWTSSFTRSLLATEGCIHSVGPTEITRLRHKISSLENPCQCPIKGAVASVGYRDAQSFGSGKLQASALCSIHTRGMLDKGRTAENPLRWPPISPWVSRNQTCSRCAGWSGLARHFSGRYASRVSSLAKA